MDNDSIIFAAYDNKRLDSSTNNEDASDQDDSSDEPVRLDGQGSSIGTPDTSTEACVVEMSDGTQIDYGHGCGSTQVTADKNLSARGKSHSKTGWDNNTWSTAATNIPYGERCTEGRRNYDPSEILPNNKRFKNSSLKNLSL